MNKTAGVRIAYVSGPVEAAKVYDDWRSATPSTYYGTLYLLDLYRLAERLDADCLIITTFPERRPVVRRDRVTIINCPLPDQASGFRYQLEMLAWALRCVFEVARFRASVAILTAGQDYFWPFALLRVIGTRLFVSLHCTLWPHLRGRKPYQRLLHWLNGHLLFPACDHIQVVSKIGITQIKEVSAPLRLVPVRFQATYDPAQFIGVEAPQWPAEDEQFALLYVGRIAANKGVFDAVSALEILEKRHPGRFSLSICGSGPDAVELAAAIRRAGLQRTVTMLGECSADRLQALYGRSHAVIVPTRSDFEEGQPKVAFEAVLNYRPLIISNACPAIDDVRAAAVETRADVVEDCVSAIQSLAFDREFYESKVAGAVSVRGASLEPANGYAAALSAAFSRLREHKFLRHR